MHFVRGHEIESFNRYTDPLRLLGDRAVPRPVSDVWSERSGHISLEVIYMTEDTETSNGRSEKTARIKRRRRGRNELIREEPLLGNGDLRGVISRKAVRRWDLLTQTVSTFTAVGARF